MMPTFVVVGRVNEGKSSIVAALVEDDRIPIGPLPGTTRTAEPYTVSVGGVPVYQVIDTPGFQQPEAVLARLQADCRSVADRPEAVRRFLLDPLARSAFEDEARLLDPVMKGAVILYVVDASHPFRPSYEAEMEVLRWTAKPRFALLNQTGDREYGAEWQGALGQFFSAVRPFNAHQVTLGSRLELLRMLGEMNPDLSSALRVAVERLAGQARERLKEAAGVLAAGLVDLIGHSVAVKGGADSLNADDQARLADEWRDGVVRREKSMRSEIERIYRHRNLQRQDGAIAYPVWEQDLFTEQSFRLLGLSRTRLTMLTAGAGALAGGVIDASVGGHSFGTGLVVGAVLGGAAGVMATRRDDDLLVAGVRIGGIETAVGPHRNPQFSWVLLDRALLHARSVINRSHAVQAPLKPDTGDASGIVAALAGRKQLELERIFGRVRRGKCGPAVVGELAAALEPVVASMDGSQGPPAGDAR